MTTVSNGRWSGLVALLVASVAALLAWAEPALAADLEGTLKKIKATNTITLGYREASRPFSFTGDDGKPAGYSVDLCTRIAADVGKQLGLPTLQVKWVKVTVADRMRAVASGAIDMEFGSTTMSLSRQAEVDFSIMTFVDGGSLLVTDASSIRGISTLGGKRVAVIPGTTTEKSLNEALKKQGVTATVVPVKDHDAGVAALDGGTADAYASDRVLLIGIGRTSKNPEKLSLVQEFFSYEPYGIMLRRNDSAFRLSVNRALATLYRSGDVLPIYEKWFGSMTTAGPMIGARYLMNSLPE
jgi:ABC-type amino acid transport substrate-binding protein